MDNFSQLITLFESYSSKISLETKSFKNSADWDLIYDSIRILNLKYPKNIYSGERLIFNDEDPAGNAPYIEINDKIIELLLSDFYCLTFVDFYSYISVDLYRKGFYPEHDAFNILNLLLDNRSYLDWRLSERGKECLKIFISYFFGKIGNKFNYDVNPIRIRANHILQEIQKNCDLFIMADTSQIYFAASPETLKRINNIAISFEYVFNIEKIKKGFFFKKKKYFLVKESNEMQFSGLKEFKNNFPL